ncbi:unnamed protein product [Hydatigera taeniaeformis]|uniref:NADH dehydrogenase [ubiquinone] iron-sulfur protein 4, mitochondrial n=1 Tax=Hydatigena taeniaeformis TaxID=6205 RepID=A0A0R3X8R2_HYDTA|nr:unnamed protein product [Hydatigera taeniaeformis]
MALSRCLNLSIRQEITLPIRFVAAKTPPAKVNLDLRRVLLNEVDSKFRTRMHDAKYESPDFSMTDTVTVPKDTDITPLECIPIEQLETRTVRIYMPSKSATQSGTFGSNKWRIELDNLGRWENPLMGWASTGDPLSNFSLDFSDATSAIAYCESQGWNYFVEDPKKTTVKPKSYAANFSWDKRTRRSCK